MTDSNPPSTPPETAQGSNKADSPDKLLDEYFSDRTTAKASGGTRTTAHRRAVRRIESLITKATARAEQYARANEHHVISGILTNADLAALSPATVKRLKARQSELSLLVDPLADTREHSDEK